MAVVHQVGYGRCCAELEAWCSRVVFGLVLVRDRRVGETVVSWSNISAFVECEGVEGAEYIACADRGVRECETPAGQVPLTV